MDPELFKKKLEQFAELKQIRPPKSAAVREKDEPSVIFRNSEEFLVDADNNPTLNWAVKKLKPHVAVCEDCCSVVENRVIEIKSYESPNPHWRRHCKPCGLVQNPYTKEFDLTIQRSSHAYACFVKGMPQPYLEDEPEKKPVLRPVFKKPTK